MKVTATDVGVGSGEGGENSYHRGHRSFWKVPEVADGVGIAPRVSAHRGTGAASRGFVQRGAGPLSVQRRSAHRGWVAEEIGAADCEESVAK